MWDPGDDHNSKWSSKISTPRPWKSCADAWKLWVLFSISKSKQTGATSSSAPAGSGLVIGYGDWADKCFFSRDCTLLWMQCSLILCLYRYVQKGNSGTHYSYTLQVDILYTCLKHKRHHKASSSMTFQLRALLTHFQFCIRRSIWHSRPLPNETEANLPSETHKHTKNGCCYIYILRQKLSQHHTSQTFPCQGFNRMLGNGGGWLKHNIMGLLLGSNLGTFR